MTEPAPQSREGQHKGSFLVDGRDIFGADEKIPDHKYVDRVICSCGQEWVFVDPTRDSYETNHKNAKACLAQHQHETQSAGD